MELELLLSFLGASILLTLLPGPDNIFVLTESLTKGPMNGVVISIGLVLGILVHTFAATTGISILIQNSEIAYSVLKYLGAFYLFYLAIKSVKEKPQVIIFSFVKGISEINFWPLVRKGFFMNVLNPKVSLFFIAFLPQFISKTGFNASVQMVFLGLIFMAQALIIFSAISILSGRLSTYLNSKKFWSITKWCKVSILSILGLALIF